MRALSARWGMISNLPRLHPLLSSALASWHSCVSWTLYTCEFEVLGLWEQTLVI